jgi:hypothetical protein
MDFFSYISNSVDRMAEINDKLGRIWTEVDVTYSDVLSKNLLRE